MEMQQPHQHQQQQRQQQWQQQQQQQQLKDNKCVLSGTLGLPGGYTLTAIQQDSYTAIQGAKFKLELTATTMKCSRDTLYLLSAVVLYAQLIQMRLWQREQRCGWINGGWGRWEAWVSRATCREEVWQRGRRSNCATLRYLNLRCSIRIGNKPVATMFMRATNMRYWNQIGYKL